MVRGFPAKFLGDIQLLCGSSWFATLQFARSGRNSLGATRRLRRDQRTCRASCARSPTPSASPVGLGTRRRRRRRRSRPQADHPADVDLPWILGLVHHRARAVQRGLDPARDRLRDVDAARAALVDVFVDRVLHRRSSLISARRTTASTASLSSTRRRSASTTRAAGSSSTSSPQLPIDWFLPNSARAASPRSGGSSASQIEPPLLLRRERTPSARPWSRRFG